MKICKITFKNYAKMFRKIWKITKIKMIIKIYNNIINSIHFWLMRKKLIMRKLIFLKMKLVINNKVNKIWNNSNN